MRENIQIIKTVSVRVDKLVEECNENIDEKELYPNKMIYNSILHDYKKYVVPAQYTQYCLSYFS